MPAIFLPPAYAVGLGAQLRRQEAALRQKLAGAGARALSLQPQLQKVMGELAAAKAAEAQRRARAFAAATEVADQNAKLAALTRELGALRRRVEQLSEALNKAVALDAQLALRAQRGAVLVQISGRQKLLEAAQAAAATARQIVATARHETAPATDRQAALQLELSRLSAELPRPATRLRLAEVLLAAAHARFVVDQEAPAWRREVAAACVLVVAVHDDLLAGRYVAEGHGEVLAGRAHATLQALQAQVALQRWGEARALFASASRPEWFFHHIFNVFVFWCFGLYLGEERQRLAELLAVHEHSLGLRGAYARAFVALLRRDAPLFSLSLRQLLQAEWEAWRQLPQKGLGLINLGGLALVRLAATAQLPWEEADVGLTLPLALRQ